MDFITSQSYQSIPGRGRRGGIIGVYPRNEIMQQLGEEQLSHKYIEEIRAYPVAHKKLLHRFTFSSLKKQSITAMAVEGLVIPAKY